MLPLWVINLFFHVTSISREAFVVELGAGQLFAKFVDGVLVRDRVGPCDVEEVMETEMVENLILGLLVKQAEEELQNEKLKDKHGMKSLTITRFLCLCYRDTSSIGINIFQSMKDFI